MTHIIVDLEATCWERGQTVEQQEIIEIGAVRVSPPHYLPQDTFSCFVRPILQPQLSDFCVNFTGITQRVVDAAELFPRAFAAFHDWIGPEPFRLASWGSYDLKQFTVECGRHGLPLPESFANHLDLKKAFARDRGGKPCGMAHALAHCGLPLRGNHHRALDDALNIARLAALILPALK